MISTYEALTGPWAANVPGWAVAVVPGSLIVVAQELATHSESGWWIAASAGLQLVAVTAWAVLVASLARLFTGRVPPAALAALWLGIGVLRGVIGALVALEVGAPPEWAYRILFWVVVTVCWMPLLTYALAQWAEHRRLLAVRAGLAAALDTATARATEGEAERGHRLVAAADDALGPALDEVRAALRGLDGRDDPAAARAIAARLDDLAARTAAFTSPTNVPVPERSTGRVSLTTAMREFELRRPVFASLLTATAISPVLLPEAFREGGWGGASEMAVAIGVSTALLIATFGILRPRRFTGAQRSLGSRIGVTLAGLAGGAVVLALDWEPFEPRDYFLIALVPVMIAGSASTIATAVALEATNVDLSTRAAADRAALDSLETGVDLADRESAARVETLVRGDLNGRLASCAMALGFLAHDDMPEPARHDLVRGVLDQLDAAAAELHPR